MRSFTSTKNNKQAVFIGNETNNNNKQAVFIGNETNNNAACWLKNKESNCLLDLKETIMSTIAIFINSKQLITNCSAYWLYKHNNNINNASHLYCAQKC